MDANIIIRATNDALSDASAFVDGACRQHQRLAISRHSYEEVAQGSSKDNGAAQELAQRFILLPYYPKGTISEVLGTIAGLAGTFDDMRTSEQMLLRLGELAKGGADLHDKGAVIDAIWAGCSHFVTEDHHLVASRPRTAIEAMFPIRIVTTREAMQRTSL